MVSAAAQRRPKYYGLRVEDQGDVLLQTVEFNLARPACVEMSLALRAAGTGTVLRPDVAAAVPRDK